MQPVSEKSDPPAQSMQYAAHGLHELYQSYVTAGFSETQAFELVKVALAVMAGAPKDR